ncbi:hypothetical protein K2173_019487 [Erythroxylum novogranatense]|uniref:Uncharacterized protein n=1 Tax=Erythroxylum novogranatense TaxID=1862640 RepID=A0AAV8UEQ7_9ROSI|nr:hypothetical protein K2173_019487 [Erythroxylum novogranatense]
MNEPAEHLGFESRRLSLIDVSFEDDCLLNTCPSPDDQVSDNSTGAGEEVYQPIMSSEPEGTRKSGRYNLRKSLAWDSAFFTSAGVLEPEELSSMIEGDEKGRMHMLPGIEEDVQKSTESISTFASESLTVENPDGDLFGDIKASIWKSSQALNLVNSSNEVQSKIKESQTAPHTEKVDTASESKLKTKAAPKKANIMQGSGKAMKQPMSLTNKPPKVVDRVGPITTSVTKRVSLGGNRLKLEKAKGNISPGIADEKRATSNSDRVKNPSGKYVKIPISGSSKNSAPRSMLPKKPLNSSGVTKTKIVTPASSVDSSGSLSSDTNSNLSLNCMARKVNSRTAKDHALSGPTIRKPVRVLSGNGHQPTRSNLSPCVKSIKKLPSSISPASSVSEWSTESHSPTSTLNKRSNRTRPGFDTRSDNDTSEDGDATLVLHSQNHSHDKWATGPGTRSTEFSGEAVKRVSIGKSGTSALLGPASVKPSGLRMPSPKIGFFDGVRTLGRTPNGSTQSHPAISNTLTRVRAGMGNGSLMGESQVSKNHNSQPAGTVMVVQSCKIGTHQPASGIKPKSPIPSQESCNVIHKVSALRNAKRCSGVPLEVRSRSPGNNREDHLIDEEVRSTENSLHSPSIHEKERSALEEQVVGTSKQFEFLDIHGEVETTNIGSTTLEVD